MVADSPARRMVAKRELIDTDTDKRYVRRNRRVSSGNRTTSGGPSRQIVRCAPRRRRSAARVTRATGRQFHVQTRLRDASRFNERRQSWMRTVRSLAPRITHPHCGAGSGVSAGGPPNLQPRLPNPTKLPHSRSHPGLGFMSRDDYEDSAWLRWLLRVSL